MEFWLAVLGWLLIIGYFFSMFVKPEWHFSYDDRIPKVDTIDRWWWSKGYPESIYMVIRWLIITGVVFMVFRFLLRVYQNA